MNDPISRWRYQFLMSKAHAHFGADERIISWARVKTSDLRRRGIVYLSQRGCLLHWTTGRDEYLFLRWDELTSWGVAPSPRGGLLLSIEGSQGQTVLRFPATTKAMADNVGTFVSFFGELAPWPEKVPAPVDGIERFEPTLTIQVGRERKSVPSYTKRIVVTVVGSFLVGLGIILSLPLVPGPGLLTIIAGLAVLSTEFDFATDALDWARERYRKTKRKFKERTESRRE